MIVRESLDGSPQAFAKQALNAYNCVHQSEYRLVLGERPGSNLASLRRDEIENSELGPLGLRFEQLTVSPSSKQTSFPLAGDVCLCG